MVCMYMVSIIIQNLNDSDRERESYEDYRHVDATTNYFKRTKVINLRSILTYTSSYIYFQWARISLSFLSRYSSTFLSSFPVESTRIILVYFEAY